MTFEAFPLFPGVPGGMELAVILLIAILLFGANKIPKLARSTGQAMGEFKKGRQAVEQELEEMQDTATLDESEFEDTSTGGSSGATNAGTTEEPTTNTESQSQSQTQPQSGTETDAGSGSTETDAQTETDER